MHISSVTHFPPCLVQFLIFHQEQSNLNEEVVHLAKLFGNGIHFKVQIGYKFTYLLHDVTLLRNAETLVNQLKE